MSYGSPTGLEIEQCFATGAPIAGPRDELGSVTHNPPDMDLCRADATHGAVFAISVRSQLAIDAPA